MQIVLPYQPRPYQTPLLRAMRSGVRHAAIVWHRRSGKEMTCYNWMIYQMLERVGTYYYFFPSYRQAQKVLWYGTDKEGKRWIDYYLPRQLVKRRHETDMRLELKNGSVLQCIGLDKYSKDTIVGTNVVGCVYSEYSLQDPVGRLYMLPIIAENGGWEIINFTPRGHNHSRELFDTAMRLQAEDGSWFASKLTVEDTGEINGPLGKEIELYRRSGVPEELLQQEYWCSFSAMNAGAYFGPYIERARSDKRITTVALDENLPVHTAWDIGVNDPTCVWCFQTDRTGTIRVLKYYEEKRTGLNGAIKWLREQPYMYGTHLAPHDARVTEWGTGRTRYEIAAERGLDLEVLARFPKDDQITAAQTLFSRCVFDEQGCANGIRALEAYEEEYDESKEIFKGKPVHNWASNGADAFQTLAMGVELVNNDLFNRDNPYVQRRRVTTDFDIWGNREDSYGDTRRYPTFSRTESAFL